MDWISVKDRLPDNRRQDLILYDSSSYFLGEWTNFDCDDFPYRFHIPTWGDAEGVTHWMPLSLPTDPTDETSR